MNKYQFVKLSLFVLFSNVLWANNCPKWYAMPSLGELVVVLPIYNINILEPDLDCDEIIDIIDNDIDGDGISNSEEIAIGTNPRDKNSIPKPFIITVNTDPTIFNSNTEFEIPTIGDGYNYNVDCNSDGIYETIGETGNYTCSYDAVGIYTITIQDNSHEGTGFPRIYFSLSGLKSYELLGINQWGTGKWKSMFSAFANCKNLSTIGGMATDKPNLSQVTDMAYMFDGAENFNQDIGSWDVSTIIRMDSLFRNAKSFNQDISKWNTTNVDSMRSVFSGAESFNQNISSWNIANVKYLHSMFDSATAFNQPIGSWDTHSVRQMTSMFHNATSFNQNISQWDTRNVREMNSMFHDASSFENHDLSGWDVDNVEQHQDFMSNSGANNIEPNWK